MLDPQILKNVLIAQMQQQETLELLCTLIADLQTQIVETLAIVELIKPALETIGEERPQRKPPEREVNFIIWEKSKEDVG